MHKQRLRVTRLLTVIDAKVAENLSYGVTERQAERWYNLYGYSLLIPFPPPLRLWHQSLSMRPSA